MERKSDMNTTNGRIAKESKEKFACAILRVMEVYNFREITVSQLALEAGLSRKTFYRLFRDKEEVLSHIFEGLYVECFGKIKAQNIQHYWDVVQCYFDFWEGKRELLTLLGKSNLLGVLFDGAYRYSFEVFAYIRTKDVADQFAAQLPYFLAYSVGGMQSMLIKWIENDMAMPSRMLIEQLKAGFGSAEL